MNTVKAFSAILLLILFALTAFGQEISRKSKSDCQMNGFSFECPQGFSDIYKNLEEGLWVFRNNKERNFFLFVSVLNKDFDEKNLFNDLTKNVPAKIFLNQPQNYQWTESEVILFGDKEKPMSKSQISSKTLKGYNKKHLLFANFRLLNFNERHFVVGYFIEMEKGKKARRQFANNFVYSGQKNCNAQLKLIYSITGEKIEKGSDPCLVFVTV